MLGNIWISWCIVIGYGEDLDEASAGKEGGLQNRKTARYWKQHWNSRKIPSLIKVVRKLPSPEYHTKLELLPNAGAQNARKTMYRLTGWNHNTAVLDRKYGKKVRKMAQNRNTANPNVPLHQELVFSFFDGWKLQFEPATSHVSIDYKSSWFICISNNLSDKRW